MFRLFCLQKVCLCNVCCSWLPPPLPPPCARFVWWTALRWWQSLRPRSLWLQCECMCRWTALRVRTLPSYPLTLAVSTQTSIWRNLYVSWVRKIQVGMFIELGATSTQDYDVFLFWNRVVLAFPVALFTSGNTARQQDTSLATAQFFLQWTVWANVNVGVCFCQWVFSYLHSSSEY